MDTEKKQMKQLLQKIEWPEPSGDLRARMMQRIEREQYGQVAPVFIVLRRPAYMALCFMVFLVLGLTMGLNTKNYSEELLNQRDYTYYSVGLNYAYGAGIEAHYEE